MYLFDISKGLEAEECRNRLAALKHFIFQPKTLALDFLRDEVGHPACKDQRDRIYDVLGLLTDALNVLGIRSHYIGAAGEVLQDVTLRFIGRFKSTFTLAVSAKYELSPI